MYAKNRKSAFASAFSCAVANVRGRRRKSAARGSRGHKFKGRFQFNDVDEDAVPRLAKRKMALRKEIAAVKAPLAVWIRVVTDYGKSIMMDADQFDASNMQGVKSATPHFN